MRDIFSVVHEFSYGALFEVGVLLLVLMMMGAGENAFYDFLLLLLVEVVDVVEVLKAKELLSLCVTGSTRIVYGRVDVVAVGDVS